jgi:hypothetical protein
MQFRIVLFKRELNIYRSVVTTYNAWSYDCNTACISQTLVIGFIHFLEKIVITILSADMQCFCDVVSS